jgi:membrane protein CcdC involved in cytochrome C biogenesis
LLRYSLANHQVHSSSGALINIEVCTVVSTFIAMPRQAGHYCAPVAYPLPPLVLSCSGAFLYFVIFVLVCALILVNLYIGVIFSNFSRITSKVAHV